MLPTSHRMSSVWMNVCVCVCVCVCMTHCCKQEKIVFFNTAGSLAALSAQHCLQEGQQVACRVPLAQQELLALLALTCDGGSALM